MVTSASVAAALDPFSEYLRNMLQGLPPSVSTTPQGGSFQAEPSAMFGSMAPQQPGVQMGGALPPPGATPGPFYDTGGYMDAMYGAPGGGPSAQAMAAMPQGGPSLNASPTMQPRAPKAAPQPQAFGSMAPMGAPDLLGGQTQGTGMMAPQPSPAAAPQQPQSAPTPPPQGQQSEWGPLGRLLGDRWAPRVEDLLLGLGQGGTANESVAMAAQQLAQGAQGRREQQQSQAQQNQSIDWLMSRGLDAPTAQMVAGMPDVMQSYVQGTLQGREPLIINGRLVDPVTYQEIANFSDGPTSVQEYEFYRGQGGQLPYDQWDMMRRTAGASQTNVNVDASQIGNIPPGWELFTDPVTGARQMREIEGGPAAQSAQQEEQRAALRTSEIQRAGNTVVQDLGRGLQLVPNIAQGDGVIGANARLALSRVPGTTEYQLQQFISSALSNVGLDRLQQMRESSPTGGALGQVPFPQQQRLEQVLGSLNLGMPIADIEANMKRIMNIYFDIMFGDANERALAVQQGRMTQEDAAYYDSLYYDLPFNQVGQPSQQQGAAPQQQPTVPTVGQVVNGYRYIGGDPADPSSWERI